SASTPPTSRATPTARTATVPPGILRRALARVEPRAATTSPAGARVKASDCGGLDRASPHVRRVSAAEETPVRPSRADAARLVLLDTRSHQRPAELARDLTVVGELDEPRAGLVAGRFDRGSVGGEEPRRKPQRRVALEVLQHPQPGSLTADVHRQVPR